MNTACDLNNHQNNDSKPYYIVSWKKQKRKKCIIVFVDKRQDNLRRLNRLFGLVGIFEFLLSSRIIVTNLFIYYFVLCTVFVTNLAIDLFVYVWTGLCSDWPLLTFLLLIGEILQFRRRECEDHNWSRRSQRMQSC